jgi:hypothetical protein
MSAPALEQFQDAFAQALLAPPDAELPREFAALAAQPGFAVYRNTVLKGCIDALQANYPAVTRLVGEEWLRAAAAIYVRQQLPTHPMLLDYDAGFIDFLANFEPAAELPYLPGVATLDRLWTEAHAARDQAPLAASALAALGPEALAQVIARPHPAARWRWFDEQPIFTIWQRNRADVAQVQVSENAAEIDWCSEGALLTRPQGAVQASALSQAGCVFLDVCAAGGTLADAAIAALQADANIDLARLMAQLLEAGALGQLNNAHGAEEAE